MAKQYITLKQAAQKWKSKAWYIKKACDAGQIHEAVKLNDEWIVPADMERPHMYIENKGEIKETVYGHGKAYKKHIYKMTMEGFPSFEVEICEVGGMKYEVYSCFSADAKRTVSEAFWDYVIYNASEESKKKGGAFLSDTDRKKVVQEYREDDINLMPSSDELRDYYYNGFVKIGFTETEIAELMAKIDEHIEKRNKNFGIE